MQPQDVLEQHELALIGGRGECHEARRDLGRRDVEQRERGAGQRRLGDGPERDREAEGPVREMRERVAGIDGERRHHGQEPALEVVQEIAGLLGRLMPRTDQADPMGFEARDERFDEEPVLLLDEIVDPGGDGQHGLARREPVGSDRAVARGDLALEPGDPDHVVLVQIRAEDAEELDALEERHRLVLGLLEHPAIELEPGQLAVDEWGVVRRHRVVPNASRRSRPSRTPRVETTIVR